MAGHWENQGALTPVDSTTWERLRMGMESREVWNSAADMGESLPAASVVFYIIWGGLVACGFVLGTWALRAYVLDLRALRQWPALHRRLLGDKNVGEATAELRALELLVGLKHPDSRKSTAAWQMLSPSEQIVAMGLLKYKSAHQLAQELACTTSYIYNLRTSIRRKWQLDRGESLHEALERYRTATSD